MPSDFNQDLELFSLALEYQTPAQRAAYLDQACGQDAELRHRLEALLEAHDQAGGFLPDPVPEPNASLAALTHVTPVTEAAGDRIGRYKLRERIGEGGCGVVYVAEQEEPVRRRVALKIIKLGMDTKSVIARFEAERQALAMMDHPNIAKIYDAGTTETGRPYFVMELVRGIRITDYCDKHKLPTGQRLDLFIKVCQAVQHAHQKGIIHRDLKPSNILVTLHDGVPVPKIIDFGIAKATEGRLSDRTVYTELFSFIGTPAYISPEQAEMSGLDIDTRSDIYSLGVLLYELLTGGTPFDAKDLLDSGLDAMRKTIREMDPPRPSTRLNSMVGEVLTTAAQRRGAEAPRLVSLIRGDLDWIVMKCLEKDRTRRYESASGLASDLRRHLENEPVVARPPSTAYRLQKAIRRNRLAFAAAAAVMLALGLGVVSSTWQAVRATRAEREQRRLAASESQQRTQAEAREGEARVAEAEAQSQKRTAEQAHHRAEALAYASDISLAQLALAENNLARARELLEPYQPAVGQKEAPSWEWRYLWQQCRGEALFKVCHIENVVNALAVSDNGQWLAVGSNYSGLSIWDISNPRAARQVNHLPEGHLVTAIAFAPGSLLMAYTGGGGPEDFPLHIWNLQSKTEVTVIHMDDMCLGLQFTGDGKTLVALRRKTDHRITAFSVPDGAMLSSYTDTSSLVAQEPHSGLKLVGNSSVAVSASTRLSAVDLKTMTSSWGAPTGVGGYHFSSIAVSPDERIMISAQFRNESSLIRAWDVPGKQEFGAPELRVPYQVLDMVFLSDGHSFVAANDNQTLQVWDATNPTSLHPIGPPLRGHSGQVKVLAMLADGKTLISGGADGSVYAWDTQVARDESYARVFPDSIKGGLMADGKSKRTIDAQGRSLEYSLPNFDKPTLLLDTGAPSYENRHSIDGRLLVTEQKKGTFQLWDLAKRRLIREFGDYGQAVEIWNLTADGSVAILYDRTDRLFHKWDLTTFTETLSWAPLDGPNVDQRSCLSSDGRFYLSTAPGDGGILLLNLMDGTETRHHLEAQSLVRVNLTPDAKFLAVSSRQGYASVYERETMRKIATVGDLKGPIYGLDLSPDGKRLAITQAQLGRVQIWDVETQRELLTFNIPSGSSNAEAFYSPDGNFLVLRLNGSSHYWHALSWKDLRGPQGAPHP